MGSQRITAAIRDAIADAAVDKRFKIEDEEYGRLSGLHDTADDNANRLAYKEAFEPKHTTLLKRIPKGWFGTSSHVKVMVENGEVEQLTFGKSMPVPERWRGYDADIVRIIPKDNPALTTRAHADECKEAASDYLKDLEKEKSQLRAKVVAVIESVTTTGKLISVWPEVTDLLPPESFVAMTMLPAINLLDLNRELGLKTAPRA